jgi:DNA-nicking Smr family endonuclease
VTRRLTPEERALWDHLRRQVAPLRRAPRPPAEETKAAGAAPPKAPPPATPRPVARRAATKVVPAPPTLARLDERARRRVQRGALAIDARIDLHGMRQAHAFSALVGFLRRAQAQGARLVLVVTGKGAPDGADDGGADSGRGVLRNVVPAWLARPELRDVVIGFEEAGRRHGGAGALYVRIRRRRALSCPRPAS